MEEELFAGLNVVGGHQRSTGITCDRGNDGGWLNRNAIEIETHSSVRVTLVSAIPAPMQQT